MTRSTSSVAALRTTIDNPVAAAIAERARALLAGDTDRLVETATAFERAGCRYQAARSLALAAGEPGRTGTAMLERLGAAPMAQ